jgi:hypothetical protein
MPLSYAQNAISANEFLAPRWRKVGAPNLVFNVILDPQKIINYMLKSSLE